MRTAAQIVGQGERQIQQRKKETTRAADAEAKKQLRAQQQLARAVESLDRQRSAALYQQFRAQEAASGRAAKAHERAVARAHAAERREIEQTARAAARAIERERKERDREAKRESTRIQRGFVRQGESFARRTSHRASRFLMPEAPIGSMVARGLGDVARGAGIDFSIQGMVGRNVAIEQLATDISNSGYQAGASGANGTRQDPRAITAQARAISGQLGVDAMDVLQGIDRFKNITGDLATSRALILDLARLSKATGTSLDDMAAAAANVSNGLGDTPDKAKVLDEVMRTVAGQGKVGAVEVSDMAVHMARVAAAANSFSGNRADIIAKMGAFVQEARATGGAPSAAEAARSVVGYSNTMKKTARINAFKKVGIDVFTDDSKQFLKDPTDLLKESLTKTQGNLQEMNKLFMDVVGARTVAGFQSRFVAAGGGDAGIKAVESRITELLKAQVSKEEVATSSGIASNTTAAKAARFQNELDKVTEGVMAKLVPALDRAGPSLIKFAETAGNVATWMVENPKTAIAGAISISIARAGVESVLRAGIERLLLGQIGVGGVGSRAAALGSAAGAIGAAGTIAALGVTTLTVGYATIDYLYNKAQDEQRNAVAKGIEATNAQGKVYGLLQGGDLQGAKKAQEEQIRLKEAEMAATAEQKPGFWMKLIDMTMTNADQQEAIKSRDAAVERATQQQIRELAASRDLLARIAEAIESQPVQPGTPPDRGSQ